MDSFSALIRIDDSLTSAEFRKCTPGLLVDTPLTKCKGELLSGVACDVTNLFLPSLSQLWQLQLFAHFAIWLASKIGTTAADANQSTFGKAEFRNVIYIRNHMQNA